MTCGASRCLSCARTRSGGVGEGAYEFGYYPDAALGSQPHDPHGLLFQIGAELGVVGLLLFACIPFGLLASLRRWWRLASLEARRSACGLAAVGATFLGQALVDWMWRIPGLTALGLLCPAVGVALLAGSAAAADAAQQGRHADPGSEQRHHVANTAARRGGWPWRRVAAASGLLAALVLVLCLYLSDVYVRPRPR